MEKSKLIIDDDSNMPVQESKDYNSITEEYALMKTEELLNLIDFENKFGTKIKFSIDDIQNQIEQEALWEHKLNDFMIEMKTSSKVVCSTGWEKKNSLII